MRACSQTSAWALVPLKSGGDAKSRLGTALTPEQRRRVFYAMAERVIRALHAANGIAAVAVVTASAEVAAFARDLGALPITEPTDLGMSAALSGALTKLEAKRPERVLILPGDLPLISATAVDAILTAATGRGIVIVPDRQRVGTNALLCTPPQVVAPSFGGASFERHIAAARAAGVDVCELTLAELALDLDAPADLELLRRVDSDPARELLAVLHARAALAG